MAARRAKWLAENGPCVKCGSMEQLEVDHIDRTKKVDHKVWSWTEVRRLEELAKCQVLCRECHKKKTAVDMGYHQYKHGTRTMYNHGGCRCSLCRAAFAEVKRIFSKESIENENEITRGTEN